MTRQNSLAVQALLLALLLFSRPDTVPALPQIGSGTTPAAGGQPAGEQDTGEQPAGTPGVEQLRVADGLNLTKGGIILGELRNDEFPDPQSGRKLIAFVTPSGGQILIERARATVQPRTDLVDRAYEAELAAMPDSADAHREMVQKLMSRTGARGRLAPQIQFHLRRLVELDPNDTKARTQLGQKEIGGVWVDEAQFMTAHGYVFEGGTWRSQTQSAVLAGRKTDRSATGMALAAYSRFRVRLSGLDAATALAELKSIMVPDLIERLYQDAWEEPNPAIRTMLLEAIATQPGYVAANALMLFAIFHPDSGVRTQAFNLLTTSGYDQDGIAVRAGSMLSQVRRRDELERIARFLGEIGSTAAILPLINVVITEHEEPNPDSAGGPGRMNFSLVGGNVQGFGINNEPATRRERRPNQSVIDTLSRLTNANFREDQAAWRRWYTENYTLSGYDLGRDR